MSTTILPKRKMLIPVSILAASGLVLAACGGGDGGNSSGSGEVVVAGFGGAYGDAQVEAYYDVYNEGEGNLSVLNTEASLGAVSVQVENDNVQWDIVELNGADMVAGCLAGVLEPIDYDVVDKGVLEENAGEECGVAASFYTVGIGYNNEDWPDEPPTWEDFYDPSAFAGKRAIESYIQDGTLEYALMGDGVDKNDLYPLDLDRAVDTLNAVADDLIVVDSLDQASQLLTSGDATLIQSASARMLALQEEGLDVGYTPVGQTGGSYWVVPKNAPNKEGAMEFLAWASECVDCSTLLGELTAYSGPNAEGNTKVEGDVAEMLPSDPEVAEISFPVDLDWWGENTEEAQDAFNRFMTSQ